MSTLPNEWIWLGFLVVDLSLAVAMFAWFGRAGLVATVAVSIVLCNIQVLKLVELFGITTTLGNVLYGSIFFATDLLGELHGPREARKVVWIGFASLVVATIVMTMGLLFRPAPEDQAHGALMTIFSVMPRIAAASIVAYLASQFHDVWAFHRIRRATGGRHLWLRNNASTLVSQAIDTVVFTSGAFLGRVSTSVFLQILGSTYAMKAFVAILDTPFLYAARALARRAPARLQDARDAATPPGEGPGAA